MIPADRSIRWTAGLAAAVTFLAVLDSTIVTVAIPDLRRDFSGSSLAALSWVITAYGIAFAALLTPAGRLADIVGRRRQLLAALVAFSAASLLCAMSPTLPLLIGSRALQGAAAATMIPAALGLLLGASAPSSRPAAVGAWAAASALGAATGPAIGGALIEAWSWRACFLVNIPLGALVWALSRRRLPELRSGETRLPDAIGTILIVLGLASIVAAVTKAPGWGWTSVATLGVLAAGVAITVAAALRARSQPVPALEIKLWHSRLFASTTGAMLFFGFSLYIWLLAGPLFLTSVWDYSVLQAGLALTPGAISSAIAAVAGGRLLAPTRQPLLAAIGAVLLGGVVLWMKLALSSTPDFLGLWLGAGIVSGAAIALMSVGLTSTAALALPPERFAAGSGLTLTARQSGGALGVAALAAIVGHHATGLQPLIDAYILAGVAAAIAGGGIALVAQRELRRRGCKAITHAPQPSAASAALGASSIVSLEPRR
jgi:EmrB/QacA subfamily drug resistance transporter